MEIWIVLLFLSLFILLLVGYPVAFTLGAVSLLFAAIFTGIDIFAALPLRIWGYMTNFTLLAVPLFVFMGVMLDRSGLASDLLETISALFGKINGGLAISVTIVGALLAATTGVVGATVCTLGIIALPTMLKHQYSPALASGTVATAGTLGQIIPPSIILILLGDVMGVPVGSLFMAAVIPSLLLVVCFLLYILIFTWYYPQSAPVIKQSESVSLFTIIKTLCPVLALILMVLGSIFFGIASPTESAAIGALGAMMLATLHDKLSLDNIRHSAVQTTKITAMVFMILIGATAFSLVFREMGGDEWVNRIVGSLAGGKLGFLILTMLLIFILGFFLDFLQICFIIIPILLPIAEQLDINLIWLAVLIGINLQTSFLTPPFGFSLFYLKAVAPPSINIKDIYLGVLPYVLIQLFILILLMCFPDLVTWLPKVMDEYHGL